LQFQPHSPNLVAIAAKELLFVDSRPAFIDCRSQRF
jgi:hypothetical protein